MILHVIKGERGEINLLYWNQIHWKSLNWLGELKKKTTRWSKVMIDQEKTINYKNLNIHEKLERLIIFKAKVFNIILKLYISLGFM